MLYYINYILPITREYNMQKQSRMPQLNQIGILSPRKKRNEQELQGGVKDVLFAYKNIHEVAILGVSMELAFLSLCFVLRRMIHPSIQGGKTLSHLSHLLHEHLPGICGIVSQLVYRIGTYKQCLINERASLSLGERGSGDPRGNLDTI